MCCLRVVNNSRIYMRIGKLTATVLRKSPRQLLDLLIKEVRFYNDKIEIYFNYTDKKSPDDDNRWDFCFYKCKKVGKFYTVEKKDELEIMLYV